MFTKTNTDLESKYLHYSYISTIHNYGLKCYLSKPCGLGIIYILSLLTPASVTIHSCPPPPPPLWLGEIMGESFSVDSAGVLVILFNSAGRFMWPLKPLRFW